MNYTLRRAITSEAKPLVGLYAESGNGKTRSALLIARGFCGDMARVAMIETESGRGEAYADDPVVGGYNVLSIREDFSPKSYGAAIRAAENANTQVLIVDSASHEWESATGVLGMAAKNQEEGKKGPLIWQRPKMDHSREFMLRLTQTPIPLVVVCMRAKYVMEEKVKDGKKDWVRSTDLSPKQSEDILYEMFIHGWIDKAHAFHGTKYTLDVLRQVFKDGEPITVDTGKRLQQWATGAKSSPPPVQQLPTDGVSLQSAAAQVAQTGDNVGSNAPPASAAAPTDEELIKDIEKRVKRKDFDSAFDLARGIQDQDLHVKTIARIDKALAFVTAKAAAK